MFKVDTFVRADATDSPDALRDAELGRIFGLRVIESSALEDATALVYHMSAFAFASLAPAIPEGAAQAAASTEDGIAVRTLFDFDPGILSDVVAISTFGGGALIDADRVVRLDTSSS